MSRKRRYSQSTSSSVQVRIPAKRLHDLGRMAAAVMHEVRDPLHLLRLAIDELTHDVPAIREHPVKRHIEASLERISHALSLTYQLLTPGEENSKTCDLLHIIQTSLAAYAKRTGTEPLVSMTGERRTAVVQCSSAMSRIMLDNLLRNALEASSGEQAIQVEVTSGDHGACVRITNPGTLQREQSEPRRGMTVDTGLGLGLSLAHQLAVDAGGHLNVEQRGGFVVATLFLPHDQPVGALQSGPTTRPPRLRKDRA